MVRRTMCEAPCNAVLSVRQPFLFRRAKYYERNPILQEIFKDTTT